MKWASGHEYVGEFCEDKMEGHGTFHQPNGDEYIGEFREDKMEGQQWHRITHRVFADF